MASCATCGSTILFGGLRHGELRFCKQECADQGHLLAAMAALPEAEAEEHAQSLRTGPCPKCGGVGQPVDVQEGYRVVSFVILTRWSTRTLVACRPCGNKLRIRELLLSLVAGWWGFPWGLLMTPVQVGRNLWGLASHGADSAPSPQLVQAARLDLLRQRGQLS